MFDNYNRKLVNEHTTSVFRCDDADDEDWDFVEYHGGYSPRNEVYLHATQFVDMWKELMTGAPGPHSKCYTCLYVYMLFNIVVA